MTLNPKAVLFLAAVLAVIVGFALPGPQADNHASARTLVPALHIGG